MNVFSSERNYENSLLLDVHRWSTYAEVDELVGGIHQSHFAQGAIERKHLKVVLLNLYVAWFEDRLKCVAVSMSPNAYRAGSRYNALHISSKTIDVVNTLLEAGLIERQPGFYSRSTGTGRLTRIWPSAALEMLFVEARFGPYAVVIHEARESIILRDEEGSDIDYEDDNQIVEMREKLRAYNQLLQRTFIDIPFLENHWIDGPDGRRISIGPHNKLVRRIFNRGRFDMGGRYFGGWWQNIPKEFRKQIYINGSPTIEIDYEGLHVNLLYALEGLTAPEGDAYTIERPSSLADGFPEEQGLLRRYAKLLMLMAINAEAEDKAFAAFRVNRTEAGDRFGSSLRNVQLKEILEALKSRHEPIPGYLGTGAGIQLMNLDSQIAESVITVFTNQEIPILCVHDSFVTDYRHAPFLQMVLTGSLLGVIDALEVPKLKRTGETFEEFYGFRMEDGQMHTLPHDEVVKKISWAPGYRDRKRAFDDWFRLLEE